LFFQVVSPISVRQGQFDVFPWLSDSPFQSPPTKRRKRPKVVQPLKMFQDSVDPMDPDVVLRTIVDELGKHPDELFVDFGQ
jgi:hypothetical protein